MIIFFSGPCLRRWWEREWVHMEETSLCTKGASLLLPHLTAHTAPYIWIPNSVPRCVSDMRPQCISKYLILHHRLTRLDICQQIYATAVLEAKILRKKRVNDNVSQFALKWPNSNQKSINHTYCVKVAHKFFTMCVSLNTCESSTQIYAICVSLHIYHFA